MRRVFLLVVLPFLAVSAEDPIAFFRSCAYTSSLPTAPGPETVFRFLSFRGDVLPADHVFAPSEKFRIEVSSKSGGYLYILQDPPDPDTVVFPSAAADRNQLAGGGPPVSVPLFFTSSSTVKLLVGVSLAPIKDVERFTAKEFRDYFSRRAHCWGAVFLEREIRVHE